MLFNSFNWLHLLLYAALLCVPQIKLNLWNIIVFFKFKALIGDILAFLIKILSCLMNVNFIFHLLQLLMFLIACCYEYMYNII